MFTLSNFHLIPIVKNYGIRQISSFYCCLRLVSHLRNLCRFYLSRATRTLSVCNEMYHNVFIYEYLTFQTQTHLPKQYIFDTNIIQSEYAFLFPFSIYSFYIISLKRLRKFNLGSAFNCMIPKTGLMKYTVCCVRCRKGSWWVATCFSKGSINQKLHHDSTSSILQIQCISKYIHHVIHFTIDIIKILLFFFQTRNSPRIPDLVWSDTFNIQRRW